ncbi:MAG: T9SS type A sorting domain-containing protein [Saprospiraceae bacterium]|nr:T9SS type A sorting domain-containing protein [Saprospiraceae bacterium]
MGFSVVSLQQCGGSLGKIETPELQADVEERSTIQHITQLDDISITPNPFTDELQFRDMNGEFAGEFTCHVFDLNGKLIYNSDLTGSDSKIKNAASWAPGLYIVRLQSDNQNKVFKVVRQ